MQEKYSTKYIQYTKGYLVIDFRSYKIDKELEAFDFVRFVNGYLGNY